MSGFPITSATMIGTLIGTSSDPSDRLSADLRHYARIEGLTAADLRPVRRSHRRSVARTAAVRDWVAALRHPARFVTSRQH